jgi:hypothetical protein
MQIVRFSGYDRTTFVWFHLLSTHYPPPSKVSAVKKGKYHIKGIHRLYSHQPTKKLSLIALKIILLKQSSSQMVDNSTCHTIPSPCTAISLIEGYLTNRDLLISTPIVYSFSRVFNSKNIDQQLRKQNFNHKEFKPWLKSCCKIFE